MSTPASFYASVTMHNIYSSKETAIVTDENKNASRVVYVHVIDKLSSKMFHIRQQTIRLPTSL